MAKILVTDLDGTLFYPKQPRIYISPENVKFLRDWVDSGNKLVIASGRNLEEVEKLYKKIQRPFSYIGCNSGFIFEEGKIIYEHPFNGEEIVRLMDTIEERFDTSNYVAMTENYPTLIYCRKWKKRFRIAYPIWNLSQGKYGGPYKIVSKDAFLDEIRNGKVYKFMCFLGIGHRNSVKASIVSKYLSKYLDYEIHWSSISIEFNPRGVNKVNGINQYLKLHNYSRDDVYVIGDSGNDVCMFKEFYNNSFCMSHANSSIKKYAKTIVDTVHDLRKYIL